MTTLTLRDLGFLGALQVDYSGQYAYSLRGYYTSNPIVIRARRSSDNAENDFYASEITSGALTTWAGSGSAFVKTWYDQSGNNKHFTQATAGSQPTIVSGGTLETLSNGLPAINFASNTTLGGSIASSKTYFILHQPPVSVTTNGPYITLIGGSISAITIGGGDGAIADEVTENQTGGAFDGWYNSANLAADTRYLDVHTTVTSPFKMRRNKTTLSVAPIRAGASAGVVNVTNIHRNAAIKMSEIIVFDKTFSSIAAESEYDQIESSIATYYGV